MKLTGNSRIASVLESLGEAFALLRKAGIDLERFLDVMINSPFTAPFLLMRYSAAGDRGREGVCNGAVNQNG
ncbi:NAD(P)-dependent oxidoreductase [Bradyrhizobium erythrophlei]|uniref:NAD(P)-dependent oxidoreductase n=1 Tax=Bradyrhizobium erythrophlei TaxID=1437360 RepID=UPI000B893902|nr:NAD(P)-dependent oxidoreductase [Bradyrhizobium erythrophlei]